MFLDISFAMDEKLIVYPGDPEFCKQAWLTMEKDKCNVHCIQMGTHFGTHVDAPLHFAGGQASIDAVPLWRLNGLARVVVFTGSGDITAGFLKQRRIQKGERLLIKTRNSRCFDGTAVLENYCGISLEAALYLKEIEPACIGIDYMTIEPQTGSGSVHRTILGAGIPVIETLKLQPVEEGSYQLYCLPLKLKGLDGSPVRAVLET